MQTNIVKWIAAAFSRTGEALSAACQRRTAVNEVASLDRRQATCTARDLGISADDLVTLAGHDKHAADLLARRMKALGLNPDTVDPAVLHDLQRCCSLCGSKQLCVHELEDKPKQAAWPKYCPNEDTLGALPADKISETNKPVAAPLRDPSTRTPATFF